MTMFSRLLVLAATVVATVSASYPGPGVVTGSTGVHDPTMCRDKNGKYFVFSTAVGIAILTSTDRTAWTSAGVVFPNGASWTDEYTGASNANLWAPECYYDGSKFYLYYSASSFGSNKSGIFLATSSTGASGSWSNKGLVVSSSTSDNYNAIDPSLYVSPSGTWYLTFGSWWTGIKGTTLASTGLSPGNLHTLAERFDASGAIEGSSIFKYGSYFYLFSSWDVCCAGTSSTYNIRVGRATSAGGPYVDKSGVSLQQGGGTLVLETHDGIYGPGGEDIFVDGDQTLLVYHYYTSSGSWLGINLLDFSSGWPVAY